MLEQLRFLEASVTIFRKRRVMRNFLVESEASKPAPRKMHAQLLDELTLAGYSVQIANQQNTQQELRIDGWTASIAIAILQPVTHKAEVDIPIDQSQQVILCNLIFQSEVVEQ